MHLIGGYCIKFSSASCPEWVMQHVLYSYNLCMFVQNNHNVCFCILTTITPVLLVEFRVPTNHISAPAVFLICPKAGCENTFPQNKGSTFVSEYLLSWNRISNSVLLLWAGHFYHFLFIPIVFIAHPLHGLQCTVRPANSLKGMWFSCAPLHFSEYINWTIPQCISHVSFPPLGTLCMFLSHNWFRVFALSYCVACS